jgi:hypothetical protein
LEDPRAAKGDPAAIQQAAQARDDLSLVITAAVHPIAREPKDLLLCLGQRHSISSPGHEQRWHPETGDLGHLRGSALLHNRHNRRRAPVTTIIALVTPPVRPSSRLQNKQLETLLRLALHAPGNA